MINRFQSILFSCVSLMGLSLWGASTAHAELSSCGDIFLSAGAACEYRPKTECMTECMTEAVEEPCVAQIYTECETSCTATASVDCESSCTQTCVDDCTTTSTTDKAPSCMDLCLDDCDSGDDACGSSSHRGACGRCQKHSCAARCESKCGDDPQPKKVTTVTECMPTCTTACSASCSAKANTKCQVDCQEKTYTQCETTMVERCNTQCKDKGGAIFCDGQFVNSSDVNSCADELKAKVSIDIDIKASVNSVGDKAGAAANSVSKKVNKACSIVNVGAGAADGLPGIPSALAGLALWLLKRRRARQ